MNGRYYARFDSDDRQAVASAYHPDVNYLFIYLSVDCFHLSVLVLVQTFFLYLAYKDRSLNKFQNSAVSLILVNVVLILNLTDTFVGNLVLWDLSHFKNLKEWHCVITYNNNNNNDGLFGITAKAGLIQCIVYSKQTLERT